MIIKKTTPVFKKIFNFIIKSLISFPSEGRALSDSLKLFGWISYNGFLYICLLAPVAISQWAHHLIWKPKSNFQTCFM